MLCIYCITFRQNRTNTVIKNRKLVNHKNVSQEKRQFQDVLLNVKIIRSKESTRLAQYTCTNDSNLW